MSGMNFASSASLLVGLVPSLLIAFDYFFRSVRIALRLQHGHLVVNHLAFWVNIGPKLLHYCEALLVVIVDLRFVDICDFYGHHGLYEVCLRHIRLLRFRLVKSIEAHCYLGSIGDSKAVVGLHAHPHQVVGGGAHALLLHPAVRRYDVLDDELEEPLVGLGGDPLVLRRGVLALHQLLEQPEGLQERVLLPYPVDMAHPRQALLLLGAAVAVVDGHALREVQQGGRHQLLWYRTRLAHSL